MSHSSQPQVLIYSPYPMGTAQGNAITALRLHHILSSSEYEVEMQSETFNGTSASCLVALNAWRSAAMIAHYQSQQPLGKVVIIITGSDINHPDMDDPNSSVRLAMKSADSLVMLHEAEFTKLPEDLQNKCTVIFPSVNLPDGLVHQPSEESFEVIMAGNLRPVKNPMLAVEACKYIEKQSKISILTYGVAPENLVDDLKSASDKLSHYNWLNKVEHAALLQKMSRASALLNTSHEEGGANAICEAISMGLPVVASAIRGNIGMLGEDYDGLFPANDPIRLAFLLDRMEKDVTFYNHLKQQIMARSALFTHANESAKWSSLLRHFL